jgi:hypothetical protein
MMTPRVIYVLQERKLPDGEWDLVADNYEFFLDREDAEERAQKWSTDYDDGEYECRVLAYAEL